MINRMLIKTYYRLKLFMPRGLQLIIRSSVAMAKRRRNRHCWPIDFEAAKAPHSWEGWPEGKQFAVVLTHDVDTLRGHDRCLSLMNHEISAGFRSSFNLVAGEYEVSGDLRKRLGDNGFEVGVHGWFHNASLYESYEEFQRQALWINNCLENWGAVGFRSPCMYRNLDWLRELSINYDASTFDTDPFEPQPDGTRSIFPFYVTGKNANDGYVELPYTLPQDFTLFVLLREKTIDIWKRKIDWIAHHGGMVLLNTHPDYMGFKPDLSGPETYPVSYYKELLHYLTSTYEGRFWHVLPREMADFWKKRHLSQVQLSESSVSKVAVNSPCYSLA